MMAETQPRGDAAWPMVTVNILAFNRRDELKITLSKIEHELDYPHDRLEIIVVDNASTDKTGEMVRDEFPDVHLITTENNIGIAGWNRGFEIGKGDYFLVLDDDCYVSGSSLKDAIKNAQSHQADLVSFLVASPNQAGYFWNDNFNLGCLGFWGCSALISRVAIEKLKGFDPNIFIWAHEVEFTIRLLDHGLKHLYLPEVVSVHMKTIPQAGAYSAHLTKTNTRNLAYIAGKFFQPKDLALAFFFMLCKILATLPIRPPLWRCIPAAIEGLRVGLRHRTPVKPRVSTVYRNNYLEYVNPFPYLRNPRRLQEFYRRRPRYYPVHKAVLEL